MKTVENNEIKLRKFGPLSSIKNLYRILSDAEVSKPFGFPYDGHAWKLKHEIYDMVKCDIVFEAVLNGKVIGFVDFRIPDHDDVAELVESGVFGDDPDFIDFVSERTLEIAYALDKDYIGQGYGKKMTTAAIDKMFNEYSRACIIAGYFINNNQENERSKNLLERLGFVPFQTYKDAFTYADEPVKLQNTYYINPLIQEYMKQQKENNENQ